MEITPPEVAPEFYEEPEIHARMNLNEKEQKSVALGSADATIAGGLAALMTAYLGLTAQEAIAAAMALVIIVKMARKFFTKKGDIAHS